MNRSGFEFYRIAFCLSFIVALSAITQAGLTTGHLKAENAPYCKVNKPLITVSPGSSPNTVLIVGAPDAISSTTLATAYAKNVDTDTRVDFTIAEDMSFKVEIAATPGQKVRIFANNRQGKRSYGTFNIENISSNHNPSATPSSPLRDTADTTPQHAAGTPQALDDRPFLEPDFQITPAVKEYSIMSLQPDSSPALTVNGETVTAASNHTPQDGTNLAVVIMVVNTDSGQVLSTTQVTGKSKTYAEKSPDNFKIMIQRILDRCKNVISSEILRPNLDRSSNAPLNTPDK